MLILKMPPAKLLGASSRRTLALLALATIAACAACGGQSQPPSAGTILKDGAAAMAGLKTVKATLTFTNGTITFQGLSLASAKATVRMPSDSDTTYTVKDQDLSIGFEVVIVGGHVYLHVPFSTFRELTGPDAALVPDLAKMFDRSTGLPAVIPAGANPRFVSTDQVGGVDAYHVSATYKAEVVTGMLPKLTSTGDVNAHVWVDVGDHLIRKAVLDGNFGDGGKEASVEVDLSAFNSAVTIATPSP